jgi:GMP synthase (glutamine-hydrolysing)
VAPKILIIQHAEDDPVSRLGGWLAEAGCHLEVVHGHRAEPLPGSLDAFDGLVVLGGAMGAYDDVTFPWLTPTKRLLREAVRADLPTLAICLGHQLLAVATGGRVTPAPAPQVGIVPLRLTAEGTHDPLLSLMTPGSPVVHWNNDLVVEVPPASVVLAKSDAGIQAIRLGSNVWGLQFHPEVDVETLALWAEDDLVAGRLDREVAAARLAEVAAVDHQLIETGRALARSFVSRLHGH